MGSWTSLRSCQHCWCTTSQLNFKPKCGHMAGNQCYITFPNMYSTSSYQKTLVQVIQYHQLPYRPARPGSCNLPDRWAMLYLCHSHAEHKRWVKNSLWGGRLVLHLWLLKSKMVTGGKIFKLLDYLTRENYYYSMETMPQTGVILFFIKFNLTPGHQMIILLCTSYQF